MDRTVAVVVGAVVLGAAGLAFGGALGAVIGAVVGAGLVAVVSSNGPSCPNCGSKDIKETRGGHRCLNCGYAK